MKTSKVFLTCFTLILINISAFSQEIQDTLFLTNGKIIIGQVVGQNPDKSVLIKTENGTAYSFQLSDIAQMKIQGNDTTGADSLNTYYFRKQYENLRDSLQHAQAINAAQNKSEQVYTPTPTSQIDYYVNKMTFNRINDRAMLNLMESYPDGIYAHNFRVGLNLNKTGRGYINAGIILSSIGMVGMVTGLTSNDEKLYNVGLGVAMLGEVLVTVGIPIKIVSGVRRNKAKNEFYEKYSSKQQFSNSYTPTMQLKLVPNGIGLALNL